METKRIILVGKGGSGKDFARKRLESFGLKYCVSHTSRPIREGEMEGNDYYFISLEDAEKKISRGDFFYEYVVFNGWIYGTSKEEFSISQLLIMTPRGISNLKSEDRKSSFIFFLDIDESTRRSRLSQRRDADSVERRLIADRDDFENFTDFDYKITDPFFSPDKKWLNIANFKSSS